MPTFLVPVELDFGDDGRKEFVTRLRDYDALDLLEVRDDAELVLAIEAPHSDAALGRAIAISRGVCAINPFLDESKIRPGVGTWPQSRD